MTEVFSQPGGGAATAGRQLQTAPHVSKQKSEPPSPEIVHINIGLANTYRLELLKTMLAISAALFAFTISFPPALIRIDHTTVLVWAWIGLAASTIAGLLNLYGWEKFYISYRDYDDRYDAGQRYRKLVTGARRLAHFVQMAGMIVGIAALAWFVVVNRSNVKLAEANAVVSGSRGPNAAVSATVGHTP